MTALAIAALALSALAVLLVLLNYVSDQRERSDGRVWRAEVSRRLDAAEKSLRIQKGVWRAARDLHAETLAAHAERFDLLPDREALEKLVEQHNQMARDLTLLKEEFSTIRSGNSLRKATGA